MDGVGWYKLSELQSYLRGAAVYPRGTNLNSELRKMVIQMFIEHDIPFPDG